MDVKSMKKLLADVYGIRTEAQLEKALKDIGGVPIAIFVERKGDNEDGSAGGLSRCDRC